MDNDLFPDAAEIPPQRAETCRSCEHRERWMWRDGVRATQYCGIKRCNRTDNGLLKIKAKDVACKFYEKEKE